MSAAEETDVFVAGGGPAGLAAAIACRDRGLRVVLADASIPPIDKTCGEGLMPDSLKALSALGISIDTSRFSRFRGIRFLNGRGSVDANFPTGTGFGIRRTALHHLMTERALDAGVSLRWGTCVRGISERGVDLDGETLKCRWIIGADGQNSQVRRWVGLDGSRATVQRFAFRRHYRLAPWTDCMEIYWGPGFQIYVTPVADDEVCLVVISRDSHLRLNEALNRIPQVRERVAGAIPVTAERGAVSVTRRLRRVAKGNVALIGDAAGSVDAITGEGLSMAFQHAVSLAGALATGGLPAYESAHRRAMRRPALMGQMMLLLDRSAWLRTTVLSALTYEPSLFFGLLALHVGAPVLSR